MIGKITVAIAALALAPAAAGATTIAADEPQSIVTALQTAGYKAVLGKDATGDPKITSASSGANFSIYFYGCENGRACHSIQFTTSYAVKPKLALDRINEWNITKRFGKAYLDKTGDPALDFDVSTDGGISGVLFDAILKHWLSAMTTYQSFIGY